MKLIILLFCSIIGLLRFYNLEKIPIFWDEAIYLNFAEIFRKDPSQLLHTFDYYSYPVMIWIQTLVGVLYPLVNPILIGRLFSALPDLISAYFIYLLYKKISFSADKETNTMAALISSLIYLSLPLTVFHSRFVMLESLTNMFVLVCFYSAIRHVRKYRGNGLNTGWIIFQVSFLILSFFTKPMAVLSFPFILFVPLIFLISNKHHKIINFKWILIDFLLSSVIAAFIIGFIALPHWNSYSYYLTDRGNLSLNTLNHFKNNIWKVIWWTRAYLTYPVIISLIVIFIWSAVKRIWLSLYFFAWLSTVLIGESLLISYFFPRHLFPISIPISLVLALFWHKIRNKFKVISFALLFILLLPLWSIDYQIVFHPVSAPIALEDRQQFFDDWTSGTGLDKVAVILRNLPEKNNYILLTDGDMLISWALVNVYHLNIIEVRNIDKMIDKETEFRNYVNVSCIVKSCILVLNQKPDAPSYNFIHLEATIVKGKNRHINIYRILNTAQMP